jgi:hypothetical protein
MWSSNVGRGRIKKGDPLFRKTQEGDVKEKTTKKRRGET